MTLKEVFKSIDKYLDSDSHAPNWLMSQPAKMNWNYMDVII